MNMAAANNHRYLVQPSMSNSKLDNCNIGSTGISASKLRQGSNSMCTFCHFNKKVICVTDGIWLSITLVELK
jgi:hypothetical protein